MSINGVRYYSVTDSASNALASGSVGVVVDEAPVQFAFTTASSASFSRLRAYGACDTSGKSCSLQAGQSCYWTCGAGTRPLGSNITTCAADGSLPSGTDAFACVPLPPSFTRTTYALNVSEGAVAGTPIGQVVGITLNPATQVPLYTLVGANNETLRDRFGAVRGVVSDVFAVDSCSGVVTLARAGVLSFYTGSTSFTFNVVACANGLAVACNSTVVTVAVTRVPQPPQFGIDPVSGRVTPWNRSVMENRPAGTALPPAVTAFSFEGSTLVYSISFGGAGLISINSSTGLLSTAASLVFEQTPVVAIVVTARDPTSNLTSSLNVQVTVFNDPTAPPTAAAVQSFTVLETRTTGNASVGAIAARAHTTGNALTYTLLAGPSSGNFSISATTGELTLVPAMQFDPLTAPVIVVDNLQARAFFAVSVLVADPANNSVIVTARVSVLVDVVVLPVPTASGVTIPSPAGLALVGGETISIAGSSFTGFDYNVTIAPQLSDAFGNRTYVCAAPTVVNDQLLQCRAPAGFGTNLVVTLRYNRASAAVPATAALLVSYAPPVPSAVFYRTASYGATDASLATANALQTAGGQTVVINGTQFGPAGTAIDVATYGNDANGKHEFRSGNSTQPRRRGGE